MKNSLLDGKRILIVDDEVDVLETLSDFLSMCDITTAQTFEEAKQNIETKHFDIAVLDIMGVDGYKLLELAREKQIIPVMLTANALSVQDTMKSFQDGAVSYVPKEEMNQIETILNEVLEAQQKGKGFMRRWLERFDHYYEKKFGSDWKKENKEFWERFGYWV
ncbi:response regulator [Desulfatiglans anilini]|uniref:response regulator n=1 Tax=Desulfatiglans anilini TaxID=90728 RepID=UPI000480B610|nr:response regulator [Desulfatiglans anilini]